MRVLIVEDERELAGKLARALGSAGFVVDQAHDGKRGDFLGRTEPYRGIDGMRAYFDDLDRHWSNVRVEAGTIHASPGRITVSGRARAEARSGGVVEQPALWRIELEDGLIRRMQVFGNRASAAAAAAGERDALVPGTSLSSGQPSPSADDH